MATREWLSGPRGGDCVGPGDGESDTSRQESQAGSVSCPHHSVLQIQPVFFKMYDFHCSPLDTIHAQCHTLYVLKPQSWPEELHAVIKPRNMASVTKRLQFLF